MTSWDLGHISVKFFYLCFSHASNIGARAQYVSMVPLATVLTANPWLWSVIVQFFAFTAYMWIDVFIILSRDLAALLPLVFLLLFHLSFSFSLLFCSNFHLLIYLFLFQVISELFPRDFFRELLCWLVCSLTSCYSFCHSKHSQQLPKMSSILYCLYAPLGVCNERPILLTTAHFPEEICA